MANIKPNYTDEATCKELINASIKTHGMVRVLQMMADLSLARADEFTASSSRDERSSVPKWVKISRLLDELAVKVKFF